MSNSKLVDIIKLSPNHYNGRNHIIDTITIHCMAGQLSAETCGNVFLPTSRQASSNYGVGYDGKIGMYVEEKNAAWTSSSYENDNRAVTIEVASDSFAPYKVNDVAYKALINLVVDICKRNNIKKLMWKADKSLIGQVSKQNMTAHRWFSATACPGDYLYSHFGDIAKKVNAKLGASDKVKLTKNSGLYPLNETDPIGQSTVKSLSLKAGDTVEWIEDDGLGWSLIKYKGKKYWVVNSHIDKEGLSSYKIKNFAIGSKFRRLSADKKNFKTNTTIKTPCKLKVICQITKGKYAGYYYGILISSGKHNGLHYYAKSK